MRLLDLFCGAGGAAMGYYRAGFEVVGVDIKPQPNFPFEFHQANALDFPVDGFDIIHASPPCQAHTCLNVMWNAKKHADFVEPTREKLKASGLPYIIENVPGAPLIDPIKLCGSMFGLGAGPYDLRRHRGAFFHEVADRIEELESENENLHIENDTLCRRIQNEQPGACFACKPANNAMHSDGESCAFCPGAYLNKDMNFCPKCGRKLRRR